MEFSTVRRNPASRNARSKRSVMAFAAAILGFTVSAASVSVVAAELSASVAQDDSRQTKYDVTIRNITGNALSGFSARIYFDISEVLAAGLTATHLRCDERYDPSGAGSCVVAQYSGDVYYADLRFGSYSLSAGASVSFKVTLRLSDWSNNWSSGNDYSRAGLGSAAAVTTRIPVYQGSTRISGTDPDGSGGDTVAPTVPTNLSATAVSSSQINLSWTSSTDNVGVTGYSVYRAATQVGSPTGTTYNDAGLSPSTQYSYEVKARDAAGNVSVASNRATAQTQDTAPGCTGALTTASAIQNAMKNAGAGAVILIASGTYTGDRSNSGDPKAAADGRPTGVFYSGNSGSASSHIVLKGCDPTSPPVLQGHSDRDGSYGIHLTGDYWEIRDLIVQDAQKGIMFDSANRGLIRNVVVREVGDEAVHFRDGSSYNIIEDSRIYNTGTYQAKYGEGVYVGSDTSATYEHTVIENIIRHVSFDGGITAEHIDVKEGATGTIIEYSTFNGTGISGLNSADSFVDIKGVNTTVRHNTGRRNGNSNVVDAFQVRMHGDCCLTGTNNRFHDNSVHLDGIGTAGSTNGYVVFATSQSSGTTSSNDVRTDGNTTNIYNRNVN